jgi:hypothetical protein
MRMQTIRKFEFGRWRRDRRPGLFLGPIWALVGPTLRSEMEGWDDEDDTPDPPAAAAENALRRH